MVEFTNQLKVLIKKNFLLKSKSKCGIICEILFPLIIVLILFLLLSLILAFKSNYDITEINTIGRLVNERNKILYGSNTTWTFDQMGVMNQFKQLIADSQQVTLNETNQYFIQLDNQLEMEKFYANNSNVILGAIWFTSNQQVSASVPFTYSIRVDSANVNDNAEQKQDGTDSLIYARDGFSSIQVGLDQSILQYYGSNYKTLDISSQLYPDPFTAGWQKWNNGRSAILKNAGGVFITAALFLFSFRLITDLVVEKETKIKEGMKMMGLKQSAYILSWCVSHLTFSVPVTLLIVIIFRASSLYHAVGWGTILLLFILYLLSLLMLSFIFCIFFDKSKFAGIISFVLVLAIAVGGVFVAKQEFSIVGKLVLSIFSPVAFACATFTMTINDLKGIVSYPSQYLVSENKIIAMLLLDIVVYAFLAWYLENVVPGEYGTKRPWYFLFTKSFWINTKASRLDMDVESTYDNEDVELIPAQVKQRTTVCIRNLRKEFHTGDGLRVAVNDLYLDMHQDQIHAFLGPNGSGKSTTIGMLTGLFPPTNGNAFIMDKSILTDMSRVRTTLGVCQQTDTIFEQLTVFEHLVIYAALKGVESRFINSEAEKMAIEVGLGDKMHAVSGTLSGGQKRKLCLGIAFIGRSQVIFLDEPTSGMDPLSRRGVWDFLLKYKKGRTIILTTHFMDEADFLGDRIAIISRGQLRCDGSSLYLKNKFGVGYLLTISKNAHCNGAAVGQFIHQYIPEATILSDAGTELSFRLPTSSMPSFVRFFRDLESNKQSLGIQTFGISITTMEEVFLRIGQEAIVNDHSGGGADKKQFNLNSNDFNDQDAKRAINTPGGGVTLGQQLKGLIIKRLLTSKKDLKSFILSIFLPAIVIVCSIILYRNAGSTPTLFNSNLSPLTFSLNNLNNITVPVSTLSTNNLNLLNSSLFSNLIVPVPNQQLDQYLIDNYQYSAGSINITSDTNTNSTNNIEYKVLYNTEYTHSLPTFINFVNDALLRDHNSIGIQTTSMPFAHVLTTFETQLESIKIDAILYFIILFTAGYALMAASFAGNICYERVYRVKRLLYISGCRKVVYWLSNLIWDYFFAFLLVIITCGVMAGIEEKFKQQFGLFFVTTLLYCIAVIPLAYLLSYRFTSNGKATGAIFGILFGLGLVMIIVTINMRIQVAANQSKGAQLAADIVDLVFFIVSPLYCLAKVVFIITEFPGVTRLGVFKVDNYWGIYYGGGPAAMLAIHCVIWITWILVLDYMPEVKGYFKNPKSIRPPPPDQDEDSDVAHERQRLFDPTTSKKSQVVYIKDLHKSFPPRGKAPTKVAVYNTTLGISKGETFGLLGLNGAGKSSSLSMLSGDIIPTAGSMYINGYDVVGEKSKALSSIGSCPQFDALSPLLSGREQLWLYCRIKGIPESKIHSVVESFISMMDLYRIGNSNVSGYSGGNKRKVSLSIAMLGNPSVVFLDEASTGCDPQVRRFMWNVISELGKDKVIILTTHSMEECEALCQRITIMKDGKLTCLGSIQHVKDKFGSGYSIDVKFKQEYLDNGIDMVLTEFPSATLLDKHDLAANFEIPNSLSNPVNVSEIFATLQYKLSGILDDYSVSQTSLEQVFLKLTGADYEARLNQISEVSPDLPLLSAIDN
ncbi:hypothetical protein CYY_006343 [Polysphondylium violaceum]|uniref:ABC transporter domain-containing protein n=1 Tax=Polysphondylium violaceum TaxID=133409 RepID=A0A8J4PQQ3_9MYCE|nr:hypothetical protein CYY_006343 [Polysphondylium violaceum]